MTGSYFGEIAADPGRGFNGGTCALLLAGEKFELKVWRSYIYSIEEHDSLRGEYRSDGEAIILEAREHYSYTWETEKRETTKTVKRIMVAQRVGADSLEIAGLTESKSPVLLVKRP